MSHFIIPLASPLLLFLRGAEPRSPCSLITVLITLPGNNVHFIFRLPSCLYHSHHLPPLHPVLFLISTSSILSPAPFLRSFPPSFPLCLLDLQSCLICVARRVPMKERPMLPTHESFTTRQDLQGTPSHHHIIF